MKKMIKKTAVLVALIILPISVLAETAWVSGTVMRILTHTSNYGKCMILLPVKAEGLSCLNKWVSLDCKGEYSEKGDGDRMLNLALIAQSVGKEVSVQVDDSKKLGKYCRAIRIDLR